MSQHEDLKIPVAHNNLKVLQMPVAGFIINLQQVTHCENSGNKVYISGNSTPIVLGQTEYDDLVSKLAELTHWIS